MRKAPLAVPKYLLTSIAVVTALSSVTACIPAAHTTLEQANPTHRMIQTGPVPFPVFDPATHTQGFGNPHAQPPAGDYRGHVYGAFYGDPRFGGAYAGPVYASNGVPINSFGAPGVRLTSGYY